jgi:hypothetical protein
MIKSSIENLPNFVDKWAKFKSGKYYPISILLGKISVFTIKRINRITLFALF